MEVTGRVIFVDEIRSGVSQRTGNPWATQTYVVETQEQYPKKVPFEVFGQDRIQQFGIQMGETITVCFDVEGRQFNNRWYASVRAYNILRPGQQQAQPQQQYQQPQQQYAAQPAQQYQQPAPQQYAQPAAMPQAPQQQYAPQPAQPQYQQTPPQQQYQQAAPVPQQPAPIPQQAAPQAQDDNLPF